MAEAVGRSEDEPLGQGVQDCCARASRSSTSPAPRAMLCTWARDLRARSIGPSVFNVVPP